MHVRRRDDICTGSQQFDSHSFKFDGILHHASQEEVFEASTAGILESVLEGYNGTILAYGQTGAGKTFTMMGGRESYAHRGIIPRVISQIFHDIKTRLVPMTVTVRISYIELYNEIILDLLASGEKMDEGGLSVAEDKKGNVILKGVNTVMVTNEQEALSLLFEGETNRAIAEHQLNRSSSRSHAIFTIALELRSNIDPDGTVLTSKFNLVDLAGSERLSKTRSTGDGAREATYINKSLTFLEQVIKAVSDKNRDHIPYRSSKLTHVLKDSIGGNCKTVMIANIWVEPQHVDETLSTLKFASRMMHIANEVVLNIRQDPEIMIKKLEKEVKDLKRELEMRDTISSCNKEETINDPYAGEQQQALLQEEVKEFLEDEDVVNDGENGIPFDFKSLRHVREVLLECKALYLQARRQKEQKSSPSTASSSCTHCGLIYSSRDSPHHLIRSTQYRREAMNMREGAQGALTVDVGNDEEEVGDTPDDGFAAGFAIGEAPMHARPMSSSTGTEGQRALQQLSLALKDKATGSPEWHKRQDPKFASASSNSSSQSTSRSKAFCTTLDSRGKQTSDAFSIDSKATRSAAFEEFKIDAGKALNESLIENKKSLKDKKQRIKEVATTINAIKHEIDSLRARIEGKKAEKMALYEEDGQLPEEVEVMDEEEFESVVKLKDLKKKYRTFYEELTTLRSEADYISKLVDHCTQQLLMDFDSWYKQVFLPSHCLPNEMQESGFCDASVRAVTNASREFTDANLAIAMEDKGLGDDNQGKTAKEEGSSDRENVDPAKEAFFNAQKQTKAKRRAKAPHRVGKPHFL